MKYEITLKEINKMVENGITTFSKKDNSPRGIKTVTISQLQIGDKIVIDNYFHTITR